MKAAAIRRLLCLALAVFTAGAWDLHLLGAAHEAGGDCQVCAVAAAPELNSDCGSELLARPDYFILRAVALPGLRAVSTDTAVFSGRAPPLP